VASWIGFVFQQLLDPSAGLFNWRLADDWLEAMLILRILAHADFVLACR
jgi:hypothetical protein